MQNHGNLRSNYLVDGLVVDDKWFLPGEGPFTVLAKVAIVNVLDSRLLCRFLGVKAKSSQATVHSRSLLNLDWLVSSQSAPTLSAHLWKRELINTSTRWGQSIASDRALRYCPTCLSMGYQSSLCQVEALIRCPQHNDLLIDHCQSCRTPTPRYAITAEAFDEPLNCTQCRAPYAPVWNQFDGDQFRKTLEDESAYLCLGRWIASVDSLPAQWPDQIGWLADPRGPSQAVRANKSVQILGVLQKIAPFSGPLSIFDFQPWTESWPLKSSVPEIFNTIGIAREELTRARVAIYKSIRRHYAKRLGLKITTNVADTSQKMVKGANGMLMPCNDQVDPVVHGFLAWRIRFENHLANSTQLSLRPVLLLWPVDWSAPDVAWAHFTFRCLSLDITAAQELAKALKGLDYDRPESYAEWMEVVGLWDHRFGSQSRPWPDGLSTMCVPNIPGGPGTVYLISAPSAVFKRDIQ